MPVAKPELAAPSNQLLAALPKKEYQRLCPNLEPFPLACRQVLYEPGDRIRDVYFLTDGVVTLLAPVEKRAMLEIGMIGKEGLVGLPVFMGGIA